MAHKVACYRKKCIKSANCFRDREELSSLYTISSHSTSSVHSTEVLPQTNRQNNYHNKTFIKEETYNGDSCRKSPYAPEICTCNVRNGIHQDTCSCFRDYYNQDYNERTPPYLKNKIESLPVDTCEYVRQCCAKPCCPVHQYTKPKYCKNLKNLEECYWAKWKPSKFECTQRRRGCCECDCPKLRAARTQDKSVEVIREPGSFENTSSNENATVQPSTKDLYKNVLTEYNNQFADPTPIINPHPEHSVRFNKNQNRVLEFDTDSLHNRKLYNELYEEYENEFMRKMEENEQRKSEYYQEIYNDMYNEYENELLLRMPSDRTETTETMPETESTPADTENTVETDTTEEKTDSITVLHKPGENQKNEDDKIREEDEKEEAKIEENPKPEVAKDLETSLTETHITNTRKPEEQVTASQQKIIRPPSFAAEHLPVKGHTYPLKSVSKKQSQEKNRSKTGITRAGSPGSMNYLPAYLQRIATNKTVGKKEEVKEKEVRPEDVRTSPPESYVNNTRTPEEQVDTSQQKIIPNQKTENNKLLEQEKEKMEEEDPKSVVRISDKQVARTSPAESYINNSRKPKEQVNLSQQKIIKPPSFAAELPAKGHTYPLKSMPKRPSQDKTKNRINRAGSPGSWNYVPSYLQRTATNK